MIDLDVIGESSIKVGKTSFEVQLGRGSDTKLHEIKFASAQDLKAFVSDLKRLRNLGAERAQLTKQAFQNKASGGAPLEALSSTIGDEDVNLLVVIVSTTTDLPKNDLNLSHPYYVMAWLD
jgi:hypothetical protein